MESNDELILTDKNKLKLLNQFCIEILLNKLKPDLHKKPTFPEEFKKLNLKKGLFVTWLDLSSKDFKRRLRGCIGNFQESSLENQLEEYTIISALEDTRFKPIEYDELTNF